MTSEKSVMPLKLENLRSALSAFSHSSDNFCILATCPQYAVRNVATPATLYVLDSSYNPPTRLHLRIANSALSQDQPDTTPKRILLLLATQNADKAPKPASFEERLLLMTIFAADLRRAYQASRASMHKKDENEHNPIVDIGVTKLPYFNDKSDAISASGLYPSTTTQVHLTGFDTLIRIMDPKYYPPNYNLAPLEPFLSRHKLRVTYRYDDSQSCSQQTEYLKKLANGERESEGGKREWAERIELVEGKKDGERAVSSTKAREAARDEDVSRLRSFVTDDVAKWIISERLYLQKD